MLDKTRTVEFSFSKLVVGDLERATAFYQAVCEYGTGYTVEAIMVDRPVRETILSRPGGGAELVLLTFDDGTHPAPGSVISAFNTVNIDAFQARVLAAGGTVVDPIKELTFNNNTMRVAFFADPEGFVLEVMER
jgi:predicted enzyme related to lactoylglutathione lyase